MPGAEPSTSPTDYPALSHPCVVQIAPDNLFGIVMNGKVDHPCGGEPICRRRPPIAGQLGNGCQSIAGFCEEDCADVFTAYIGDRAVLPQYSPGTSTLLMNRYCNENSDSRTASPPGSAVWRESSLRFQLILRYSLGASTLKSVVGGLTKVASPSPCDASAPEPARRPAAVPPSRYHLRMILQVPVIVQRSVLLHIDGD